MLPDYLLRQLSFPYTAQNIMDDSNPLIEPAKKFPSLPFYVSMTGQFFERHKNHILIGFAVFVLGFSVFVLLTIVFDGGR